MLTKTSFEELKKKYFKESFCFEIISLICFIVWASGACLKAKYL